MYKKNNKTILYHWFKSQPLVVEIQELDKSFWPNIGVTSRLLLDFYLILCSQAIYCSNWLCPYTTHSLDHRPPTWLYVLAPLTPFFCQSLVCPAGNLISLDKVVKTWIFSESGDFYHPSLIWLWDVFRWIVAFS